jgi:hypothetical protein
MNTLTLRNFSRHGVVTAWLTSKRPANVIRLSEAFVLSEEDLVVSVTVNLFLTVTEIT